MDIGEVAKKAKVTTATLRFYEEKGLIKSIGRQGLRRQYSKQVIDQLALIALGRAAGFSLNEIATMFEQAGNPHLDRQKLKDKAELKLIALVYLYRGDKLSTFVVHIINLMKTEA